MSMISTFKRRCDKKIGGCGKEIDKDAMVTIENGKLHLCQRCAARLIKKFAMNLLQKKK